MDDWLVWQLIDSAFPSGGFAHSNGLEAAWQNRLVTGAEDLTAYLDTALKQINRGILVFGRRAWQQPDQFDHVDADCDLFLNNHVANRSSRAQGKALLSSAAATFDNPAIKKLAGNAREQRLLTHLAPVFGFITQKLGLDEDRFVDMFLFMSARGSLSAAVRLGIVGPLEAQRIQAALIPLPKHGEKQQNAMQINPLLDLLQAAQDRLYSRLFQS